jgi:hypothetical protein
LYVGKIALRGNGESERESGREREMKGKGEGVRGEKETKKL